MRYFRLWMAAGALAALAMLGSGTAEARPRISLTVPAAGGDAGASVTMSFAVTGVPHRARVVLQRQQGSAHVWRTVRRLTSARGFARLPGLPLGQYHVRLAVLRGHRVLAARTRTLRVFGNVDLAALLQSSGGVYTLPTSTFSYALREYDVGNSGEGTMFTISKNSCRSVHLDFVPGGDASSDDMGSAPASASLVHETLDPVTVSVIPQTVGSLDATVVPGTAWSFKVSQGTNQRILTWYVRGSASCYRSGPGN